MIPASARLPEVPLLVQREGYFVVHAPRQTGKTTSLRALASELTSSGQYAALLFSCESARVWSDDIGAATDVILDDLRVAAEDTLPADLHPPAWPDSAEGTRLSGGLRAWARACPRPLVLFFDEIDSLRGAALISVLSQLRNGFQRRPDNFPSSVALCGLRDVRDYKAAAGGDTSRLRSGSPFNIKVQSLRLGDFTASEVRELYGQHTADTGQQFTEEAVERALELTAGQPWLVNALAAEVIDQMRVPASEAITRDHMDEAKERLILARATHLDSLVDKLNDPRVARVLEPALAGTVTTANPLDDDLLYTRDLGLIAQKAPVRVANPIYREIIARVLTDGLLEYTPDAPKPRAFVRADGKLDIAWLLDEFATFWKANGEILTARPPYNEAGAQLVFQAFLQRVVNGGGRVEREYAAGMGRMDLRIEWPYTGPDGEKTWQRVGFELKAWADKSADPIAEGLTQLDEYLDRLGLDTGVLAVFDRRDKAAPITERTSITTTTSPAGRPIALLRG